MLRFIHAADIHLDSPLKGLEKYDGAPADEIRGATRRALENLVNLAIDREVDFVLIAGDLYDGNWKDHNTGLFFVQQMNRLRDSAIPVVMISGNHDAENRMTRSLRLPDNVEQIPHSKAGTAKSARLAELGVAVHGQSFGTPAELRNLAQGYPKKVSGLFNVGLLHTSLEGAEGHAPYAPCSLNDLRQKEYDYWALGHVHARRVCCEETPIVFPGNIQGRHIRESGGKGCYFVTADEQGRCELEFVPLDVFRWEICTVDATGAPAPESVLDRFATELDRLCANHSSLPLAVRIEVTGATAVHDSLRGDHVRWTNELRAAALGKHSGRVWVEKIRWQTTPVRKTIDDADRSGAVGTLLSYIEELRDTGEELCELAEVLGDLQRKLPDELIHGENPLRLDDRQQLRQWLDEVEPLLLNSLREGAGE